MEPQHSKSPQKQDGTRSSTTKAVALTAPTLTMETIQRSQIDPSRLTPTDVTVLQRSIGNSALSKLLGRNGRTRREDERLEGQSPSDLKPPIHEAMHTIQQNTVSRDIQRTAATKPISHTAARIQRYPASVFDAPGVDWETQTKSVKKSGEGVSGGVYFFRGNSGPVENVVVKPEFAAPADASMFPDEFIKAMGIKTPDARLVAPQDSEGKAILRTSKTLGSEIPTKFTEKSQVGDVTDRDLLYFKVMAAAQGSSVSSESHKVSTRGDVNDLITMIGRKELLFKVGRLMTYDALAGNRDRISLSKANLGNIMFRGTDITAIDSGSELRKLDSSRKFTFQFNDIEQLFTSRKILVQNFIEGIIHAIEAEEMRDPYTSNEASTHFKSYPGLDEWRAWISAGIDQGMTDIKALLSDKKRKGDYTKLKSSARDWEDRGGEHSNWDTFKTGAKFMGARQSGKSEKDAYAEAQMYAQYRAKRDALPKALKYTAKLDYKRKKFFS